MYVVRMAQFVLKIEKLSHIIAARRSQDLRSLAPIMAPGTTHHRDNESCGTSLETGRSQEQESSEFSSRSGRVNFNRLPHSYAKSVLEKFCLTP